MKKQINDKLFEQIYEVVNIRTDEVEDVTLNDGVKSGENTKVIPFFEKPRTIQDLRVELCRADIPLSYVLKTPEQVFYSIFNYEDDGVEDDRYELIQTIENKSGQREILIVHKTYGACAVFNVSKDYNVFDLKVIDNFLTTTHSISKWYAFVKLMDEAKELIYLYEHPFEEDENENE